MLAGLLTSGSFYLPRLPKLPSQWIIVTFVPGYSGGSVMAFNHLPFCASTEATSIKIEVYIV